MAHLNQTAAIFSPSVARAAASTAKDWSYIDGWLRTKYSGRTHPAFERNADTLRALLALAAHNEAVDEERDRLFRIEEAALKEVQDADAEKQRRRQDEDREMPLLDGELTRDDMLSAVENGLTREGRNALDAMANMAVELGMAYPTPETLGCRFVELHGKVFELDQTIERVGLLQKYLDRESKSLDDFIDELHDNKEYKPDPDLARQNLELQRQIKAMSAKLPDLKQQVVSLEKSVGGMPSLAVEHVRKDEEAYLDLLAKKKHLDTQVQAFAALPPDVEAARAELDALRTRLRNMSRKRDTVFEGLVERETPVKSRRRP